MHTTPLNPENTARVHHNGDWSGPVQLVVPLRWVLCTTRTPRGDTQNIEIPEDVLATLIETRAARLAAMAADEASRQAEAEVAKRVALSFDRSRPAEAGPPSSPALTSEAFAALAASFDRGYAMACQDHLTQVSADFQDGSLHLDLHLDEKPPYIITTVDKVEGSVEAVVNARGYTVGDNWTCSAPEQKQADGRWKLYVEPWSARPRPR